MPNKKGSNWQELLRRWLSGAITAREEQDLDRYAQNDPFLAEALEGYRRRPQGDHLAKITELKGRLARPRRTIHFWQLAAAVAVLVLAGIAIRQLNPPAGENLAQMEMTDKATDVRTDSLLQLSEAVEKPVVEEEKPANIPPGSRAKRVEESSGLSQSNTPTGPASPLSPEKTAAPKAAQESPTLADIPAPASYSDRSGAPPPPASKPERPVKEETGAVESTGVRPEAAERAMPATRARADQILSQPQTLQPGAPANLSGTVQTTGGEPLIGANVRVEGTSLGTVSGLDGKFFLSLPASTPTEPPTLVVSYTGYQTKTFVPGDQNIFVLEEESAALDEIVISDLSPRKSEKPDAARAISTDEAIAGSLKTPQPAIDSLSYRRYIEQNLRYPEAARRAGIAGVVTLQFNINKKGRPTNFVKIQSLDAACDEEAIRLLRDGPDWVPAGNSLATYSIRFEIK